MSQRTNLFALIIAAGIILSGCREAASSYMPSNTSKEASLKQEQIDSPYLSTISEEEFNNRFYSTYTSNICWLSENELLVQGVADQNDNLESVLSITNIDTWVSNVILEENNVGYLTDIIKLKDDIYTTKINGDYIVFDKNYNVTQKKYFDVPDTLAAIFNPVNDTLYYYENGSVFAENSSGKKLAYSLPSQWQESGYIRAITLSPSY